MKTTLEKLEFALQALKTIADLDDSSINDLGDALEMLSAASSIAAGAYRELTRPQEPGIDLNDLINQLHESDAVNLAKDLHMEQSEQN